jgi:hypothetical protein
MEPKQVEHSAATHCYAGSSVVHPVPGVSIGCISEEARDLMDTILDAYKAHYNPATHTATPDDVYQFTYWLCRYSGLIRPA